MLSSIAIVPFISRHFWEKYYPAIAAALGLVTGFYYVFVIRNTPRLLLTCHEYISFIVLIGSLFVVSGGIHIRIKGIAKPYENVLTLGLGAILSNLLGTTGASMILIRPFIRANRARISAYHIVFFIFIVSNMGGALTPIGDPPLFLGYLKGVPFLWVIKRGWHIWAVSNAVVLAVFYLIDRWQFSHQPHEIRNRTRRSREDFDFSGMHNLVFLAVILAAVFIETPFFLREAVMILASVASYYTTRDDIHRSNDFNFIPIKEVAILFAGIFATMIPALDWLELNGAHIGLTLPSHYYWVTGALSSVLDNAPTYLAFLSAAFGQYNLVVDNSQHMALFLSSHPAYVIAISMGAVFFGAMTYIGNGPNFMVKSIAEQAHVHCPSFFGYILRYSLPILFPLFFMVYFLFFRASL